MRHISVIYIACGFFPTHICITAIGHKRNKINSKNQIMKAEIYNQQKMERLVRFAGCEYGYNCYPTDIDGVFNIRGEINITIDAKEKNKKPDLGQTLTYCDITDALIAGGTKAVVVWAEHSPNDEEIYLADCRVRMVYLGNGMYMEQDELIEKYGEMPRYIDWQNDFLEENNVRKNYIDPQHKKQIQRMLKHY